MHIINPLYPFQLSEKYRKKVELKEKLERQKK